MNKLIEIARQDLKISLSEKGAWFNLIVMPIVFIMLIGFVNGGSSGSSSGSPILVDVIDADNTSLSADFLAIFKETNPRIVLCPADNDDADICNVGDANNNGATSTRLEDGAVRAVIEIPAGFETSILGGSPVNVIYRSNVNPLEPDFLVQNLQVAVQRIGGASVAIQASELALSALDEDMDSSFRQDVYAQASQLWSAQNELIRYHQTDASQDESATGNLGFRQSVPGMGSMYVMFTVLAGTVIMLQERRQWTLQRMVMMPVSRAQIIGGKMGARFVMGMIQYAVAFGFGALMGVNFGNQWGALLLLMVAFVLCMTAITFFLSTFVETEMQASGLITFVVLTMAPLGGAWWPLEIVPPFMQTIAMLTPIGWVMKGFSDVLFYGGGIAEVLLPVAVLLGMAAVCFFFAVRRFRYE
jgi:ABC-2 type transport system permease protein